MRYLFTILIATCFAFSCSTSNQFQVTALGYEPAETGKTVIYALPQTGLKINLEYQKKIFIPGPYADYAQRLLGIDGVDRKRTESYRILFAGLESNTEPDFRHLYSMSWIEGDADPGIVNWAGQKGLILRGAYDVNTGISASRDQDQDRGLLFTDVTMEPNVEKKEQTIYKTLITDTSFVRVPVTTEQMERKTIEKKAEEAARLILEIRSDRYYLSAGLVDPLPAAFDLNTALESLDKLEEAYLSLFIGKSYVEQFSKEYYLLPAGSLEPERYVLEIFSEAHGIGAAEGNPVELVITPAGNARSLRNLLPQEPEAGLYNHFYYRIPETCDVAILYDTQELARQRISIFQSGAIVREKISSN